jgi:hypothetical protein
MLAWDKETGADWDLTIAERCLVGTFCRMIDAAPDSAVGIVNQLGDFLHFDGLAPMTPTHHHILDADSRYQKMVEVAVRILRRVIEHALKKHATVVVQMKEGNHDPAGSVWLRIMFALLYEKNPRVKVDMSPNPYTVYQHGKTLLGFYHGHLAKLTSLGELFSPPSSGSSGVRARSCTSTQAISTTSRRRSAAGAKSSSIPPLRRPMRTRLVAAG